jgi:hypothetical protein
MQSHFHSKLLFMQVLFEVLSINNVTTIKERKDSSVPSSLSLTQFVIFFYPHAAIIKQLTRELFLSLDTLLRASPSVCFCKSSFL